MEIPNNDNLKARIETGNPEVDSHIRKLKASLKKTYELVAKSNRKSHQRNKNLYDCRAKGRTKSSKETAERSTKHSDQDEESELQSRRFPLEITDDLNDPTNCETLPYQTLDIPSPAEQTLDTPTSERTDPNYSPPTTPKSRRELQITRAEPPITRSRTRICHKNMQIMTPDSVSCHLLPQGGRHQTAWMDFVVSIYASSKQFYVMLIYVLWNYEIIFLLLIPYCNFNIVYLLLLLLWLWFQWL